jgi:uncharacterized protein
MGILTDDMKRVVREQRLGFVATVCPDGTPNLSPKGTVAVWDDEHLVFVDLRSPQTLANLTANPAMEVNVVDPIVRKGYRFKGEAQILDGGELFEEILAFFERERGMEHGRARASVLMRVDRAAPLISPVYDLGVSEDEIAARWREHHLELDRHRDVGPPSE